MLYVTSNLIGHKAMKDNKITIHVYDILRHTGSNNIHMGI